MWSLSHQSARSLASGVGWERPFPSPHCKLDVGGSMVWVLFLGQLPDNPSPDGQILEQVCLKDYLFRIVWPLRYPGLSELPMFTFQLVKPQAELIPCSLVRWPERTVSHGVKMQGYAWKSYPSAQLVSGSCRLALVAVVEISLCLVFATLWIYLFVSVLLEQSKE